MEHKEPLNAAGFDAWAQDYEADVESSSQQEEYPFAGYEQVLEQVTELVHCRPGVRVLELGVGTGALTSRLIGLGHPLTGMDFSQEMLPAAAKLLPGAELIQWDFSCGMPPHLPKQAFDCIVSTYALHHLTPEQKTVLLRGLRAYLAPEGAIFIGDLSFSTRDAMEQCAQAYGEEWDAGEYEEYFVPASDEVVSMWKKWVKSEV